MNKIYKLVKNKISGALQAFSELAKGAKKGSKLKITSLIFISSFSTIAFGDRGVPQNYDPAVNGGKIGSITVSGEETINLGLGNGFSSASPGSEAKKYTITSEDSISDMYQVKYVDLRNAENTYSSSQQNLTQSKNQLTTAENDRDILQTQFNEGKATQAQLDAAIQNYNNAQLNLTNAQTQYNLAEQNFNTAKVNSDAISNDKFKIEDPNNLLGQNSSGVVVSEKKIKYKDPVTGKNLSLTVKDNLKQTSAEQIVKGSPINVDFYEKLGPIKAQPGEPDPKQYSDMEMINITGSDSNVTISGGDANKNKLTAISKDSSGVIKVNDGANLTFDTDVSYYTGGAKSVSEEFREKDNYGNTITNPIYTVNYKGTIQTALGERTITNEAEFNAFNQELINYIKSNEQLRLEYSSAKEMQEFYDNQIDNLYTLTELGSFDIKYTLSPDELDALAEKQGIKDKFDNKVTIADKGKDIGLEATENNYFVGVYGSGSVITLNEGKTLDNSIDNDISSGTVIKADFDTSGSTSKNKFEIAGTINANGGDAIKANNADINIVNGLIKGNIELSGEGDSTGKNALINDGGDIDGQLKTDNSIIINKNGANIDSITYITDKNGNIVKEGNNITIKSDSSSSIGFIVIGKNADINNDGKILNKVVAEDNLIMTNSGTIGGDS